MVDAPRLAEGEWTAFPKIDLTSERKTLNTVKRIHKWLLCNALNEPHEPWVLACANPDKLASSEIDDCSPLLWGTT